jgi:hypothetical protein
MAVASSGRAIRAVQIRVIGASRSTVSAAAARSSPIGRPGAVGAPGVEVGLPRMNLPPLKGIRGTGRDYRH